MLQLFRPKYEVEECLSALREVLESGWTGTGPQCKKFEDTWCQFIGVKYAHFMNSATAALHVAIRLLDLPKGSKILTTPLTFVSTNGVILYEGHEPVFVDINDEDLSLDSEDFLDKANSFKTKAGIWVHYAGNVSTHFDQAMKGLAGDLTLIEDCAHAAGGYYEDGSRIGSRKDTLSCFSFQAVKNLPTFDSGMLCIPFEGMIERTKRLAWLGIDKDTFTRTNTAQNEIYKWKYDVPELGWKYNGNDISAAIANTQFKYLDRDNQYRKQIYKWYQECFKGQDKVALVPHLSGSAHHLVVIRVANRDEVITALKSNQIAPGVHYLPNYEFPVFRSFYTAGQCPNAERISKEIVSLPNHLMVTQNDVQRICEIVLKIAQ
jgi:dTDP-4-amino-4,6-dideoxygalactose transaminase